MKEQIEIFYCNEYTIPEGIYKMVGNVITPIVYFRKQKHISQREYDAVVSILKNKLYE